MHRLRLILVGLITSALLLFSTSTLVIAQSSSPFPTPVHPSPPYTPPLNPAAYPCNRSAMGSFHPLRPYPANPCDPLIPQKTPEAQYAPPTIVAGKQQDLYLSFRCSPSAKPTGLYTVKDVVDISNLTTLPPYSSATLDQRYICTGTPDDICFYHRVTFNVALNYSTSQLPVLGNTQDFIFDQDKVNNYLAYYLNGTTQQAERPTDPEQPYDEIYRLVNFSGPVKRLLSYESQRVIRDTLRGGPINSQYHNYIISGSGRLRDANPKNPNVPFSSLEDITSEATVSLPTAQPSDMDGVIVNGTLALSIGSADSRLYFPHLRNVNALSDILASTFRPGFIYDSVYTPVSADSTPLVSQNITNHQGIDDNTNVGQSPGNPAPVFDYLTGQRTRNTEVVPGRAAPSRLYESDPICDLTVGSKPGDDLVGNTINTTLSFVMLFHYSPQLTIGDPCPAGAGNCTPKPCALEGQTCSPGSYSLHCCYGSCPDVTECEGMGFDCQPNAAGGCGPGRTDMPYSCNTGFRCCGDANFDFRCVTDTSGAPSWCSSGGPSCGNYTTGGTCPSPCCRWISDVTPLPGNPSVPKCPAWPTTDLTSAGRIAVYTKTPLIERIYDTLVASTSSVLRRFIPHPPEGVDLSSQFKTGRATIPGSTYAQYSATSPDLHNVSVTAGNNGAPSLYFAHLGSLFNHFLGNGGVLENLNLQCFLRPWGSCTKPKVLSGVCHGTAFAKIFGNPDPASARAVTYFNSSIAPKLTPDVVSAYEAAEVETGVPCEVLAGIHFIEADNSPTQNLQNGGPLVGTLAESAVAAAHELLQHACPSFSSSECPITSLNQLIEALSNYNGGSNRNCQAIGSTNCAPTNGFPEFCGATTGCSSGNPSACVCPSPLGIQSGSCRAICGYGLSGGNYPYQFTYAGSCPPPTYGWDDPYVTNWWKSPDHDSMSLLFFRDCTATNPEIFERPGSLTVAITLFLTEQGPAPASP